MIIDSHCHAWDYWPYQDKNYQLFEAYNGPGPYMRGNTV